MAVPKRKSSKARKNKRRSNVWKISAPAFSKCPNCGALTVPTESARTAASTRAEK